MVVDLAVEHEAEGAILARHRLAAGGRWVGDGKPGRRQAERATIRNPDLPAVRAAVPHRRRHPAAPRSPHAGRSPLTTRRPRAGNAPPPPGRPPPTAAAGPGAPPPAPPARCRPRPRRRRFLRCRLRPGGGGPVAPPVPCAAPSRQSCARAAGRAPSRRGRAGYRAGPRGRVLAPPRAAAPTTRSHRPVCLPVPRRFCDERQRARSRRRVPGSSEAAQAEHRRVR